MTIAEIIEKDCVAATVWIALPHNEETSIGVPVKTALKLKRKLHKAHLRGKKVVRVEFRNRNNIILGF